MKRVFYQIFLMMALVLSAAETFAQQPKAFETVKYIARARQMVFRLDYAEGYLGASRIRLIKTGQKPQVFSPDGDTPEADGEFVLRSAVKHTIILTHINDESEAPETIQAIYRKNGRVTNLMFYKRTRQNAGAAQRN